MMSVNDVADRTPVIRDCDKCEICFTEKHKYKCPTCKLRYCSVPCYKRHKENPCLVVETAPPVETLFIVDKKGERNRPNFVPTLDDEPDLVPDNRLCEIGKNRRILRLLNNPHLRTMIASIAKADNWQTNIGEAMMEPIFVEFVNKCLQIVDPPVAEECENMILSSDESDG